MGRILKLVIGFLYRLPPNPVYVHGSASPALGKFSCYNFELVLVGMRFFISH